MTLLALAFSLAAAAPVQVAPIAPAPPAPASSWSTHPRPKVPLPASFGRGADVQDSQSADPVDDAARALAEAERQLTEARARLRAAELEREAADAARESDVILRATEEADAGRRLQQVLLERAAAEGTPTWKATVRTPGDGTATRVLRIGDHEVRLDADGVHELDGVRVEVRGGTVRLGGLEPLERATQVLRERERFAAGVGGLPRRVVVSPGLFGEASRAARNGHEAIERIRSGSSTWTLRRGVAPEVVDVEVVDPTVLEQIEVEAARAAESEGFFAPRVPVPPPTPAAPRATRAPPAPAPRAAVTDARVEDLLGEIASELAALRADLDELRRRVER